MARPRRFSDAQLLDAAAREIVARGDAGWTLADVATASAMSPAALVKRFGSKLGLLRALATRWADGLPAYEPRPDADPRGRIVEWARQFSRDVSDPATARGHFVLLVEEMLDPQARTAVVRGHRRQADFLAAALEDAWQRGLLAVRPGRDVPRVWLDLLGGAALSGALADPRGALRRAVRHIEKQLDEWSSS